jgi:hypothetical protein
MNRRALTLPANPNGDDNGNGYTNVEEWLHAFAAAVEGRSGSGTVEVTRAPSAPTNVRITN